MARLRISPRFAVYLACVAAAVAANYILGKEMMWDTLDYHLYAGFSALHDRFSQDYFAAGPQSYFNPYLYVPFYLLVRSGLPALVATSILAAVQSGVLWLTYEIAVVVAAAEVPARRIAIGLGAVAVAFANPILIAELGSSYSDITTAELVLAGWLLLVRAVGSPSVGGILCAGLLLGAVSALKLTNSAHALSAFVLLLFLPTTWRARIRFGALFALALGSGFLLVAAPWAIRLERHFGNPLFPLLNDVFRSPYYTTGLTLDYRFIPDSIIDALWRPFAIAAPLRMVDNEYPSPDLRYAVLLILGVLALLRFIWLRSQAARSSDNPTPPPASAGAQVAALACGFVVDWILWLTVSGNGRYFLAMACIAAVLVVVLTFRLLEGRPKLRNYLVGVVACVQVVQLAMGAGYRVHVPWDGGQWFEVSVPEQLAAAPNLYLLYGNPSNAFLAPFLASGSGFVNIGSAYALAPEGPSGLRIQSLVHKYEPHVRVVLVDPRREAARMRGLPDITPVKDELGRFGLRIDPSDCSRIVVNDTVPTESLFIADSPSGPLPRLHIAHLVTCHVVSGAAHQAASHEGERSADLVFDRLENACPALFHISHPQTRSYGDEQTQIWGREYPDTGLMVYVGSGGRVVVRNVERGGSPEDLGSELEWLTTPPRVACGRRGDQYYVKLLTR